jgi:outer membrane protein OmpA-like peptidoglycan-associated protein
LIVLAIPVCPVNAQESIQMPSIQKKLLIRDSLDYKNIPLLINTKSNEFSPIPYRGGLIYISNKPDPKAKIIYNKIYWSRDVDFKIINIDTINNISKDTFINKFQEDKNDDFTAPTSNDNDILTRYKRIKFSSNNVEQAFLNFSTDQAFTYNDSTNLLIYANKFRYAKDGIKHWALWQANLINGKLVNKKRLQFVDKNIDYLYPYLSNDGTKLYFSSNLKSGEGGYDIYFVNIKNGIIDKTIFSVDDVNTINDEIAPSIIHDTLIFSSNREGGLGGFDAYYFIANSKRGVQNIGYPVNSEKDEVSIKKAFNEYYLTTNRNGNFDILTFQYFPVTYTINGILTYKNDGSLAPNHLMYLKDKDADIILDSIITDNFAKYSFVGKPNREYEFTTLNGDSLYEQFSIQTIPNQIKLDYVSFINGRSPKQKTDSLNVLWAIEENKKSDSIAKYTVNTKFVVHYGFDKSFISKKEQQVLDSLIKKLKILPKVFVSIGAFTDCIGTYNYNYQLSVKRGKAVVDYLIKNGIDKQRIISNGYSKKYTISPCLTKYSSSTKKLQQNSRRAEIVLSENQKIDWATLEKQRGNNYYSLYNASNIKSVEIVPSFIRKDSLLNINVTALLKSKNELKLKSNLDRIKKDSLKLAEALRYKQAISAKLEAQKMAIAAGKVLSDSIAKLKRIEFVNALRIKDSMKSVQVSLAKQALELKLASQKEAQVEAKKLLVEKAKVQELIRVNAQRVKDSINIVNFSLALSKKQENLNKAKLERTRLDSISKAKSKADAERIAQVNASRQRVKDSLATVALKELNKKSRVINMPIIEVEEELSKEEILKSLEVLAKLKLEQERIVEYLTKRINKKPILIYVSSDSVSIEIYDNGIHDKDSVSILYNKRIVVDKQELKVNKPIKFKLKVDKDSKNNELIFIADNLGSEPPNTGVMFITEKSGRRQQIVLSTDMTHNEVIYFIRIAKQ